MNVLVVNDDGIKARGIFELVNALSAVADVYVCAPEGQRSAKSQAITLGEPVYIQEVSFPGAKKAWQISGTPADCTKVGIQFCSEEGIKPDIVYSGINMGSNLGNDTLYSGTVGAAMEAAVDGIHAIAVSVDNHEAEHFDAACSLAVQAMNYVLTETGPEVVVSINVPDVPANEIKGVKFVPLGCRYYDDKFHKIEYNKYELSGQPAQFSNLPEEVDITEAGKGFATITPLRFDYTDYENLKKIKKWSFNI